MKNLQIQWMSIMILISAFLLSSPVTGLADEITDQFDSARAAYESGNYNQALQELNFAVAQIQTKMEGQFADGILPDPLPGWELSGSGESTNRTYTQGDASVSVSILTQPFMIQSEVMLLSNPMILSSSGAQVIKIKGEKARQTFENDGGEMAVLIDNTAVVKIEGYGLTSSDVLAQYANAVNYEKLRSVLKTA